jgi:ATP-binding cassette subfamily B protein
LRSQHESLKTLVKIITGPNKIKITIIVICIIISTLVSMAVPQIARLIMDEGVLKLDLKVVTRLVLFGLCLFLFDQIVSIFEVLNAHLISSMFSFRLWANAIKKIFRIKLNYFRNKNPSQILSILNMDIGNITQITSSQILYAVLQIFKILGGTLSLVLISWKLTIFVIAFIPIRIFLVRLFAQKKQHQYQTFLRIHKVYSKWAGEIINGIKDIKLRSLEQEMWHDFTKIQRKYIKIQIKMALIDKLNEILDSTVFQLITDLLYIIGVISLINSNFTPGGLFAFLSYSVYVVGPISVLINVRYSFANITPSVDRYNQFQASEQEEYVSSSADTMADANFTSDLTFENVSFSFENGKPTITNANLTINKGDKVAIIGSNGSGKSTLIDLLLRIESPHDGRILIDGKNINDLSIRKYRSLFAYVGQEVFLFNKTINENIFSKKTKTDISKLSEISYKINASALFNGNDKSSVNRIGVNGGRLSGGERKKISLLRALIAEKDIYIFDEATANLDENSIIGFFNNFDFLTKGKTSIVITHRLDMLEGFTKIVLIHEGRVEACDSLENIMTNYKNIVCQIQNH